MRKVFLALALCTGYLCAIYAQTNKNISQTRIQEIASMLPDQSVGQEDYNYEWILQE